MKPASKTLSDVGARFSRTHSKGARQQAPRAPTPRAAQSANRARRLEAARATARALATAAAGRAERAGRVVGWGGKRPSRWRAR